MPVNLKDRDAFHLTIEEYLLSLISLIDELVSEPTAHFISLTPATSLSTTSVLLYALPPLHLYSVPPPPHPQRIRLILTPLPQARLARNSVTQGDYSRPVQISKFIKDIHAGFQILNLKNDVLRKRSDGIKYRVKEVEDVVYDLSLRGLVPKN